MIALPVGWELLPLSDVCLRATKSDPVAIGRSTIKYIDIGSIDGSHHSLTDVPTLEAASAPTRARQIVRTGDTVFSTVRPYLEKIAYVGMDLEDEFASTGFCVLRPGPRLDPRWLFHFSTSRLLLDQVLPHQRGVSYPAVRDKDVLEGMIPLPNITTQRRIVEILEDHLSRLDAATSSLIRTRRRLEGFKASALGAIWSESDRLGDRLALELVGDVITGATPRDRLSGAGAVRIPFVTPGDVGHGEVIGEVARSMSLDSLPPGRALRKPAVLAVCIGATLGKIGWTDRLVSTNQQINALLIGNNLPAFVAALMAAPEFQSQMRDRASATTMPILNKGQFSKLQVPVPTPDDQQRLLARLELMLESAQRQGEAAAAAEIRTKRLRQSLLAAAFSGRLTGRGMDAEVDEELASV